MFVLIILLECTFKQCKIIYCVWIVLLFYYLQQWEVLKRRPVAYDMSPHTSSEFGNALREREREREMGCRPTKIIL